MTHISDLLDPAGLAAAIAAGDVTARRHPKLPMTIHHYSNTAMYARRWNPVTNLCRGLVLADDGTVLARPYSKFHNWEHVPKDGLGDEARVEVTDKIDGAMALLVHGPDGPVLTTKGGFESLQGAHANALYAARYASWRPDLSLTPIFEVVYPGSRVVIDYGIDDLVLLGAVDIETGTVLGPGDPQLDEWPGPRTEVMAFQTLGEVLTAPSRPEKEGYVVRFLDADPPLLVKMKEKTYLAAHWTITETSARVLWRSLAVNACSVIVAGRGGDWGRLLGIDPKDAARALGKGPDWQAEMAGVVPDEFHDWTRSVIAGIEKNVAGLVVDHRSRGLQLRRDFPDSRAEAFRVVSGDPWQKEIMLVWAGEPRAEEVLTLRAWRETYPVVDHPFADRDRFTG